MHKIIDGSRMGYDDSGCGDVLVLLHGFGLDRTIWDAQFDVLQRRARVIRLDLRGSGESDCGSGPALMESLAGDVFGLLDALGVERAILAGHSMGGYVALAFFRMYAERVAGLALVASQVGADSPQRAVERDQQAAAVLTGGLSSLAAALVRDVFASAFAARNSALVERVEALISGQSPVGLAAQIIGMKERLDSSDLLEDISVPSLIVAGCDDVLLEPARLESTARAIRDCEFIALPGVAHMPMFEGPDATTAALERLIARSAVSSRADPQSARVAPA